ncbi:MAG: type II secretion system minor pseudopilin GspJ [Pseudomonadota bacterium]
MFKLIKSNKGKQTGFTLIEIMIAVFIFAIIAAIIFPALIQFLDVRERILERQQKTAELQKLFLFLERDLRFASNRLGKDEYGDPAKSAIVINDDYLLDLTTLYPDLQLQGAGVPRRVTWELDDDSLIRKQYPVMDPDGDTRFVQRTLLEDVEDIEIELSFIEEGRSSTTKRWSEETKLPDLISIKVELEDDTEYERVFTMLSSDKEISQEAVGVPEQQPSAGGDVSDSDQAQPLSN